MKRAVLCVLAVLCLLMVGCSKQTDGHTPTQIRETDDTVETNSPQQENEAEVLYGLWYFEHDEEYLIFTENHIAYWLYERRIGGGKTIGGLCLAEKYAYNVSDGVLYLQPMSGEYDDGGELKLEIIDDYLIIENVPTYHKIMDGVGNPPQDIKGRWSTPSGKKFFIISERAGEESFIEFFLDGSMLWDNESGGQYSIIHDGTYLYLKKNKPSAEGEYPFELVGKDIMLIKINPYYDGYYDDNGESVITGTYDRWVLLIRE